MELENLVDGGINMEDKFSIDHHEFGDKKFNCPNHKIEGKHFIHVATIETTYCVSEKDEEVSFVYKDPKKY